MVLLKSPSYAKKESLFWTPLRVPVHHTRFLRFQHELSICKGKNNLLACLSCQAKCKGESKSTGSQVGIPRKERTGESLTTTSLKYYSALTDNKKYDVIVITKPRTYTRYIEQYQLYQPNSRDHSWQRPRLTKASKRETSLNTFTWAGQGVMSICRRRCRTRCSSLHVSWRPSCVLTTRLMVMMMLIAQVMLFVTGHSNFAPVSTRAIANLDRSTTNLSHKILTRTTIRESLG